MMRTKKSLQIRWAMAFLLLLPVFAIAEIISDPTLNPPGPYTLDASGLSREVYSTGQIVEYSVFGQWRISGPYPGSPSNTDDGCLVLLFQLPDRQGKLIEVDLFALYYMSRYSNNYMENIDIYGITPAVTETEGVTAEMYYFGPWAFDFTDAECIEQAIITAGDSEQTQTWRGTGEEGNLRLSCWLNRLYDNGAQPGDYAALRLNGSAVQNKYMRIDIASDMDPMGWGPRIYYSLVDTLPVSCPDNCTPPPICTNPPEGDVYPHYDNEGNWLGTDCKVDINDLAVLLAEWLRCDLVPERFCD